MEKKRNRFRTFLFVVGMVASSVVILLANKAVVATSTDEFCESCHIHPHATQSWKLSTHFDNQRGIQVHCVDCHLPPQGEGYLWEKTKTGLRDVYGKLFKDPQSMNWEAMSEIEYAKSHAFESSCIHCHRNNYPLGLSADGRQAHLYYEQQEGALHCINCHITVGHYDPDRMHAKNTGFGIAEEVPSVIFTEPGTMDGFNDFTERIPGSSISFEMVAIPGGTFNIGSPAGEPFRKENEGPVAEVTVNPFFIGKIEVSWDEYLAFFKQTGAQGKTADAYLNVGRGKADAISGPTPPWGAPDQGWGKGKMPAITMTHHAAEVYCQWLTRITGKTYRLPTEAEWEYAARGGSATPYFFDGNPRNYVKQGIRNKLFGVDTSGIQRFINYRENSGARSMGPEKEENPFGLVNMLGNVAEFCSDRYADSAYALYGTDLVQDPKGPPEGDEHVIRGGSHRDGAENVRCASRESTRSVSWLKTDPQIPKSIWWYSDCTFVGFRVVCEFSEPDLKD
jgi:formylglycine-generating enzyme required for sulfatase activity